MNTIEDALKVRQVIGQLRALARGVTSSKYRTTLRAVANKIDERQRLNLSTSWWVQAGVTLIKNEENRK